MRRPSAASGPELYRQFVGGAPQAVARVTALVSGVVHHRGYYIPYDERADIVQDVMLTLFHTLEVGGFVDDRGFYGFMRMVTHRRCVDWVRARRKRDALHADPELSAGPDAELLAKERARLGSAVVARLRKSCRELFALHAGHGLTYAEIAARLGRTEGALRTQAYECLKQARSILDRIRRRRRFDAFQERARS